MMLRKTSGMMHLTVLKLKWKMKIFGMMLEMVPKMRPVASLVRPVKSPTSDVLLTSVHLLSYIATVRLLEDIAEHNHNQHYQVVGGAFIAGDQQHGNVPIVIDSSCLFSVTPYLSDFPNGITPTTETEMTGLSDSVGINGVGWADWPIQDVFGCVALLLQTKAYHVPKARICLFSTQSYFQELLVRHLTDCNCIKMMLILILNAVKGKE
jgi:hypothetical protein